MALSHRVRCLQVVQADLLNLLDVAPRVILGWRHWKLLAPDRFPAIYLDVEETGGSLEPRSSRSVEGEFLFSVFGYTKPLGPFPDPDTLAEACLLAREALLKDVWARLMSETIDAALLADNRANGGGFGVMHLTVPPPESASGPDAALVEGFGLFRLRCAGQVHVTLENF